MLQRTPVIYYVLSAIGLPLFLWAFAAQSRVGSLPSDFPASALNYPLRIEGIAASSPEELRTIAEGFDAGRLVEIAPAHAGPLRVTLARNLSRSALTVTLVSGLFFWAVCAFVFSVRAASRTVRDFFWCTFLYGLAIMVGGVHFPGQAPARTIAGAFLQISCLAALPPTFVHLTLSFPRRRAALSRAPWLMRALGLLAAVFVAWQGIGYLRYHANPGPQLFGAMRVAETAADLLLVLQVTAGFLILATGYRRLELTRERAQVKWLLWGFAIGVTPYVFLRTFAQIVGLTPPFGPAFDRLFELAIPIAFVAAVVLYRFLDIDIIIRRSVLYTALAVLMIAIIAGLGLAVRRQAVRFEGTASLLVPVAIGTAAGMLFLPLRRIIGWWIDRTFFKLTFDYGRALDEFATEMRAVSSEEELFERMDRFLADLLRPRRHALLAPEGGRAAAAGDLAPAGAGFATGDVSFEEAAAFFSAFETLEENPGSHGTSALPNATSLPEIETAAFPEAPARVGFVVGQRVRVENGIAAVALLGLRETERRYIERDIQLIRSAAAEAGRALERIRLVQSAAEEAMARRRIEELERLKSDFLSRVAHDLRTPLASIVWSTENLLDGVSGEIGERQAETLRLVRASAGHLNRLVTNLLEISRLERGKVELAIEPVNARAAVEQAIAMIRPLACERDAAIEVIEKSGGFRAPAVVLAEPGKLLEVLLNLLDNALKFSPRGGTVTVEIEPLSERRVAIRVRDRGPGLGAIEPASLFERFRQGAPSPHGPQHGFGLGLYIARTYLELMDGEISGADQPGGGAVFTCVLRQAPSEESPHVAEAGPRVAGTDLKEES